MHFDEIGEYSGQSMFHLSGKRSILYIDLCYAIIILKRTGVRPTHQSTIGLLRELMLQDNYANFPLVTEKEFADLDEQEAVALFPYLQNYGNN